ncbi:MAG: hypothetical protein ACFBZ8_10425 [Opitutales bacterium]
MALIVATLGGGSVLPAQNTFFTIDFPRSFGGDLSIDDTEASDGFVFCGTTDFTDDLNIAVLVFDLDNPSNEVSANTMTSEGQWSTNFNMAGFESSSLDTSIPDGPTRTRAVLDTGGVQAHPKNSFSHIT